MISNYLLKHHKEDLIIILQDQDDSKHFSINIKLDQLLQDDSSLANKLLREFDLLLTDCNESAIIAQNIMLEESEDDNLILKNNIHIRLYNFPSCPELVRTVLPKNQDVGLFLEVSGTIVRTTAVKLLEYRRRYKCKKCKQTVVVEADFEQSYLMIPPSYCTNSECNGTTFAAETGIDRENSKDYQEIKIQEQISHFTIGLLPNSLWVILEDDLVDSCKPGDNVTICGIVKRRWRLPAPGKKIHVEIVIKANHVYVNNDITSITIITPEIKECFSLFWLKHNNDPIKGRDFIVKSFCPQVYGLFMVKLALMVTLAGGSQFQGIDDTRIKTRSEPHILLVGDPGTGKSQLLRFASKIVSRSVFTTGVGSTSAGLTVTAVNENGEWQLEAGALVLSDGGVCCIDEFNSMKEHDRTSIHEAMEQQTISVAKASIVCKLNTRCSILAATNPKGGLDSSQALSLNIALPSPLLSRFDLVLILKDSVDENWDGLVADYILNGCIEDEKEDLFWDIQMLQAYIIYIKKIQPTLTEDTTRILSAYYQLQRKAELRNKARTTVRLLDSLVRLSQGHAKLMCHNEVEIVDSVMAVILVEASMYGDTPILGLEFDLLSTSPDNPAESYVQLIRTTLSKLELFDLLEKELRKLEERKKQTVENEEVENTFEESTYFKMIFKRKSSSSGNVVVSKRNNDETFDKCNPNKKTKLNSSCDAQISPEREANTSGLNLNATSNLSTTESLYVATQKNSVKLNNENRNLNSKCVGNELSQNSRNRKIINQFRFKSNRKLSMNRSFSDDLQESDNNSSNQGKNPYMAQETSGHLELNIEDRNCTLDQNNKINSDSVNEDLGVTCIKDDLKVNKSPQKMKSFFNQFCFKPKDDDSPSNNVQEIKQYEGNVIRKSDVVAQNLKNNTVIRTELNISLDKCNIDKQNNKDTEGLNSEDMSQNSRNKKCTKQFGSKLKAHATPRNNNDETEKDIGTSQKNYSQSIFDKPEDYNDLDLEL